MSGFQLNNEIHEGSWLMAELSIISIKCPNVLKEIVPDSNKKSFNLYTKNQSSWEPAMVTLSETYISQGLVDIELACSLLFSRPDLPQPPTLPSSKEVKKFQSAHSELSWRMLLGPKLVRQPQWVVANQSGEYYMWMKNTYGESRILATASPNTSRLQTSFFGISSLGLVGGVYSWELTKHEAYSALDLLLPHDEKTNSMSLIISNPEFCDRFSGITIGLIEEKMVKGPHSLDESDDLNPKSPLIGLRPRAIRTHTLESLATAIDAQKAEERDDEFSDSETVDKFDMDDSALMRRTTSVGQEDEELVDEIMSRQPVEEGWPLIGYAQFSVLGSWVEIGNVILSIERTLQENEKGSFDMTFLSRLVLTCASSGARILSTTVSHTISMTKRDTSVRWLSPNEMGLTNIVIVEFETDTCANTLCNTIATTLGVQAIKQYAMLPTGRMKEHSLSEIPKSDPVTIMTSAGSQDQALSPRPSPSNRPSLFKSGANRVIALNVTVRSFRHSLEVARERKGLMTLARACGMASRTERMLEDGDFQEARKLVLRSSTRSRKSSDVEHVIGLSMDELHLDKEPFAHGGSGNIFKGTLGSEQVIAKCMIESDMNSNQQLLNEVRILSSLTHVNIIRVFGVADASEHVGEDALWYLVEEYADKGDLSDFIVAEHYTPALFAKTTLELVAAIRFMHSHLICHLDLKLENVLLKGPQYTVKVADFGTSKRRKNQEGILSDTSGSESEDEAVVGTICYMPPETFDEPHKKEKLPSEFAWDCYSLGVMLWAMWERKLPWEGLGLCQIFRNVTKGRRPKFSSGTLPPAPSPELRLLVSSMWNKHPQNRPEIEEVVQTFANNVAPQLKFLVKTDDWHGKHTDSHSDSLSSFELDSKGRETKVIVRAANYPPPIDAAPPAIPEDALIYI